MLIGIEVEGPMYKGDQLALACAEFPYTKESPLVLDEGSIHPDGQNIELALSPSLTAEEQWDNYTTLCDELYSRDLLKADEGMGLCSALLYPATLLETHEGANEVGCSPSFIAYGDMQKSATPTSYDNNFRAAGLHLNIDFTGSLKEKLLLVRALDHIVGCYSVYHWEQEDKENNTERRKLYGMAGNYRIPSLYDGVEYRTLPSMVWNEDNCHTMYNLVDKAVNHTDLHQYIDKDYQDIINNCDKEKAGEVL